MSTNIGLEYKTYFTKSLEVPELGWSLHMTGAWRAQYKRMIRWYLRAKMTQELIDKMDFIFAFFENAYHLRYWIEKTTDISKESITIFVKNDEYMKLCKDIANFHKHYSNDQKNIISPTELFEYSPGYGNITPDETYTVLRDGEKYEVFGLMDQIIQSWNRFLELNKLVLDE